MKALLLVVSHLAALTVGVALGIYLLPILTAPESPAAATIQAAAGGARFTGTFRRDLAGSDALHWGEGTVSIGAQTVAFEGRLAPGPDYRLYLSPQFVETEAAFLAIKSDAIEVGPVRTFENFLIPLPPAVDPAGYTTAVVWCETFGQFISAAAYR